jgi:hypothetical protein
MSRYVVYTELQGAKIANSPSKAIVKVGGLISLSSILLLSIQPNLAFSAQNQSERHIRIVALSAA